MTRLTAFGDQNDIDAAPLSDDALAEREADALGMWHQALDERAFNAAEAVRLEILAARREADNRVEDAPF